MLSNTHILRSYALNIHLNGQATTRPTPQKKKTWFGKKFSGWLPPLWTRAECPPPPIGFFFIHILKLQYDKLPLNLYHIAFYHIFTFSKSLSYSVNHILIISFFLIIFTLSYYEYDEVYFFAISYSNLH